MSQEKISINALQPMVGLQPLYDLARRLDAVPKRITTLSYITELVVPFIDEILTVMDIQLSPKGIIEDTFHFGYVRARTGYFIAIDEAANLCTPQTSTPDTVYDISGWITGMSLGYGLAYSEGIQAKLEATAPHFMHGLWLHLSALEPTEEQYDFLGNIVQLPDSQLFNPNITYN